MKSDCSILFQEISHPVTTIEVLGSSFVFALRAALRRRISVLSLKMESEVTPLAQYTPGNRGFYMRSELRDEICQKVLKFCVRIY